MSRRGAVAVWLLLVALALAVVVRARFTADLSAFLPRAPTEEQQLLVDQLKEGAASRLLLIAIEGADPATRTALSQALARRLRGAVEFDAVENGAAVALERERALLFAHRYALSSAVTPERFSAAGLRAAISETLDALASPAGLLIKSLLARDPTGETLQIVARLDPGGGPRKSGGVWVSRDGARAILVAHTRAAGSDTDGQARAIASVRAALAAAQREAPGAAAQSARLLVTGPGVFSVAAREAIKGEVTRLSLAGTAIVVTLLILLYRSATALALGLLPVACGALAGVAAVALGFGTVHGLTLGFGTTLIGEAVDYSIYLFVQSEAAGDDRRSDEWLKAFWPTVRLGVLTSVAGFASLTASGFPGLAQLGVYSIAGLFAAAAVTRFVLPRLLPAGFRVRDVSPFGRRLVTLSAAARALRWPVLALVLAACALVFLHRQTLWNTELAALNPVPKADQALDARLRADLGAPDVRFLVLVSAPSEDGALARAERVGHALDPLVEAGQLAGYQSPANYLPSRETQRARLASLPEAAVLRERLAAALQGLPLRPERLDPFVADVEAARSAPPLTRADLAGTSLALGVETLLQRSPLGWSALLPLQAPTQGASAFVIDPEPVRAAVDASGVEGAHFLDLKAESDRLYAGYLEEAARLSALGLAAIVALLGAALRSAARVARVLAPLVAAIAVVAASLVLAGERLTLLHLVGMLLIVAVGSNYALFFDSQAVRAAVPDSLPRTLASLVFANLTTVAAFGLLAASAIPVLQGIGVTVGPGAVLALLFAAIFSRPLPAEQPVRAGRSPAGERAK